MVLLLCILICLAAGGLGSIATAKNIPAWYKKLKKPSLNPPNWIFGPVWTTLYILMGISLYLIVASQTPHNTALIFFVSQLILNALWSFLFFSFHKLWLAFGEIILLWLFIAGTIFYSWQISVIAAILLIPYICWVSFASYLNFKIANLNSKAQ